MLSNTLTFAHGGTDITLVKVNQDAYASEYRLRTNEGGLFQLFVRHNNVQDKSRGAKLDRHNVELRFTPPTLVGENAPRTIRTFITFEVIPEEAGSAMLNLAESIVDMFGDDGLVGQLTNWES